MVLTAAAIQQGLRTQRLGRQLSVYGRVDSTNGIARELAEQGAPEGTAVIAREQTGGRGRLGRPWASPPGGLWLSLVLRPPLPVEDWPLIGLAMTVGIAVACETVTNAPVRLKWPNDLVLEGRKLGGVLVEAPGGFAIAGIGLNSNVPADTLPEEIRTRAVSLSDHLGHPVDLVTLTQELLLEVERHYDLLSIDRKAVIEQWRRKAVTLGRRVRVLGPEVIEGVAESVDDRGALVVRTEAGPRTVVAGDVLLREFETP